jgi:hypothetical protein
MSFFWAAHPQLQAVDQAVQHMGSIQLAVHQLVAHAGPGGFLAGDDLEAVLLVETLFGGDGHAGAVGEGNEADLHLRLFRGVGTGRPGGAAHTGGTRDMRAAAADMLAAFFRKSRFPSLTMGCSLLGGRLIHFITPKKTAPNPRGEGRRCPSWSTKILRRSDMADAPLRRSARV